MVGNAMVLKGERYVTCVLRDITERNRLDRALEQRGVDLELAKAAAETASQAKSDFLSSMSHETGSGGGNPGYGTSFIPFEDDGGPL